MLKIKDADELGLSIKKKQATLDAYVVGGGGGLNVESRSCRRKGLLISITKF